MSTKSKGATTELTMLQRPKTIWERSDPISFSLSEEESQKVRDWVRRHQESCPPSKRVGFVGDTHFSIRILPTSVVDLVTILCDSCGAEEKITDVSFILATKPPGCSTTK